MTSLRTLILEDNPSDYELVLRELRAGGFTPTAARVASESDFAAHLDPALDLIIADYHLPQFDARRAFQLAQARGLDIPFLVVSGEIGEEQAVEMLKDGAADYLLKDRLARLSAAVTRALEQKRLRDEKRRADAVLRESEERYRAVVEQASDSIFFVDLDSRRIVETNAAFRALLGYSAEECRALTLYDIVVADRAAIDANTARLRQEKHLVIRERQYRRKDGALANVEVSANLIYYAGREVLCNVVRDLTARKRAEAELHASQARYRDLVENSHDLVVSHDLAGTLLTANPAIGTLLGYAPAEMVGKNLREFLAPEVHDQLPRYLATVQKHGAARGLMIVRTRAGARHILEYAVTLQNAGGAAPVVSGFSRDVTARVEAERALRASQARYRRLFDDANDIVYTHDLQGNFTSLNRAGVRITGYTLPEALRLNIAQIVAPEYLERIRAALTPEGLGMGPVIHELEILAKDGRRVPLELSTRLVFKAGKPSEVHGIARDIAERRRGEQALRESEERYRSLAEASHDLTTLVNRDWQIEYTNTFAARQFGVSPQELIGKRLADIFPAEIAKRQQENLQRVFESGESVYVEAPVVIAGDSVWLGSWLVPIKDERGRSNTVLVVSRDISERKAAEQRLRESEVRFRALVENSQDGVTLFDTAGRILYSAPAAERILGYASGERVGESIFDFLHPDDAEPMQRLFAELLQESGGGVSFQVRYRRRDGAWIWLDGSATNLLNEPGVNAVVVNYRDITVRKRAEEALRSKVAVLQALAEIDREIIAADQPQVILDLVCRHAAELLGVPKTAIATASPTHEMSMSASFGLADPTAVSAEFARLQRAGMFSGEMAERGPLGMDEIPADSPFMREFRQHENVRAFAIAPLIAQGQRIGALTVFDTAPHHWSADDLQTLGLLAGQSAIALHKIWLFEEIHRRADEFAALYETARDLASQQDLKTLLATIVEHAAKLLDAHNGSLCLYDPAREELEIAATFGDEHPIGTRLRIGEGLVGIAAQTRAPVIVENYSVWENRSPQYVGVGYRAGIAVPLIYAGELVGALDYLELAPSPRRFTDADARLLSLFASQAAGAVHNARLLDETRQRATQLGLAYDAALTLNRELDARVQLEFLFQIAQRALHADDAAFFRYDAARQEIAFESGVGAGAELEAVRGMRFALGEERGLVGWVAAQRLPLYLPDVRADPRWIAVDESVRSVIWVPLVHEKDLIGVLSVGSARTHAFTPQDERLLILFANQIAVALLNARLLTQTRHRAEEQSALYEISAHLARTRDANEMCDIVARALHANLNYSYVSVTLRDPPTGDRVVIAQYGENVRASLPRLRPGQGLSEKALLTGATQYWRDVSREPQYVPTIPPCRSELDVPIQSGGQIVGVLVLEHTRVDAFTPEDIAVVQSVAEQLGIAIDNAELFEETRHRLTELEAVNRISTALRAAQTLPEMFPLLLDETLAVLDAAAGSIALYEPARNQLEGAVARGWFAEVNHIPIPMGQGIAGTVLESGKPQVVHEFAHEARLLDGARPHVPAGWGGVAVPIRAAQEIIGVLFVSVRLPREIQPSEVHLLTTVAEIAGNAIHRTRLFAETQARVERLQALHEVDAAIIGSLDLKLILDVLLERVVGTLHVDAADVLLLNAQTFTLEFAAGRGFWTREIERTRVSLNASQAGAAASARRTFFAPNLAALGDAFVRHTLRVDEEFVAYFVVPLVAKGQVKGVLEMFHRTPLAPDEGWKYFAETLAGQASIAIDNAELFEQMERAHVDLLNAYETTLEGWTRALDLRDKETEGHTRRVTEMTVQLAGAFGLSGAALTNLRRGALLHDIGKMGIPDSILQKPATLTPAEWEIMRTHPTLARDVLESIEFLGAALEIPYCHHEKWDGTGYPRGLAGAEIPRAARIFSVVDVYDALTSDRPYRQAWSKARALEYIRDLSGKQFDPDVVQAFLRMVS